MKPPRLLDLFCGAGGAARGYQRAGFYVVGVDINPQPRYAGDEFIQANVMELATAGDFDAIHASPPCQAHSTIAKQQRTRREYDHPDLVADTRDILLASGLPWVMENVEGAPMTNCVVLCGSSFGLDVRRHRLFELGLWDCVLAPPCAHGWQTPRFRRNLSPVVGVYGRGTRYALASVVGVHGHINYTGERDLRKAAMGVDWMSDQELTQAIPPAYTEWIGVQLMRVLTEAAA